MSELSYSPGLEGVIATATRISYLDVDHEEIVVRGYDLVQLARQVRFPDAAYLVIYGELAEPGDADAFCRRLRTQCDPPADLYRLLELLPASTSPMDGLRTGISFLAGLEDPAVLADNSRDANLRKGLSIFAHAPAIAANAYRVVKGLPAVRPEPSLGYAEDFLRMATGDQPSPRNVEVFDRVLTCYIEHEMPNSTFAARVIASTLSDMYGAVAGAVASLKGPLHGGANEASAQMLLEILDEGPQRAEDYVMEKLRRGARIMGFGHRVYARRYDPRAYLLKDDIPALAEQLPRGRELYAIYQTVEQVMLREKGLYPNTDYPIGLLLYLMGVPIPLFTPIFLCARLPGLIAHVIEQHEQNRLFRPRVQYEGPRGYRLPDDYQRAPC